MLSAAPQRSGGREQRRHRAAAWDYLRPEQASVARHQGERQGGRQMGGCHSHRQLSAEQGEEI